MASLQLKDFPANPVDCSGISANAIGKALFSFTISGTYNIIQNKFVYVYEQVLKIGKLYIMANYLHSSIKIALCLLLLAVPLEYKASASIFSDPNVPDGEQILWRVTKQGKKPGFSTITWNTENRDGRPVYRITTDSGASKQAEYIIDRADLRLMYAHIKQNNENGKSDIIIKISGKDQYLTCDFNGKRKKAKIEHPLDGYNGILVAFSLRGFPFGKQDKVKLKITPPIKQTLPFWTWKMWKSSVKLLGVETTTVPAGTFECYKLVIEPSSRLIKRFTSKYYVWFAKKPPHHFVKYQDKDGKSLTELVEITSTGRE